MSFVLDANIPYSTKEVFRAYGTVIHVRDVGRQADPDDEVMRGLPLNLKPSWLQRILILEIHTSIRSSAIADSLS